MNFILRMAVGLVLIVLACWAIYWMAMNFVTGLGS